MKFSMKNPIICVDFDGVIHQYKTPWTNAWTISDPPVPGAIEWLKKYLEVPDRYIGEPQCYTGPVVVIYSSRSKWWRGRRAMKKWLIKYGLESEYITDRILKFPIKKPPAFLTIDDRAICFNGKFPTTEEMMNFKPWNRPDGSL